MKIKKIGLLIVASMFTLMTYANTQQYTDKEFQDLETILAKVNEIQKNSSYAILDGYIEHMRSNGEEASEYPISMSIVINKNQTITQIIIDSREGYMVSKNPNSTSIVPLHKISSLKKASLLETMGVNPNDLALGFMNDKLQNIKFPEEKIKMVPCLVLLLEDDKSKEVTKLFLAKDYMFPLRADFYNNMEDFKANKLNRTLEVSAFKKKNELFYVSKFNIYAAGWRTIIEFDKAQVDYYNIEDNLKIFRELKK